MQPGVGDGRAEGHHATVGGEFGGDPLDGGPDGGLGRPVEVPQRADPAEQRAGEVGGERLAAAQRGQSRGAGPVGLQQHPPGGGGGLEVGDALLLHPGA